MLAWVLLFCIFILRYYAHSPTVCVTGAGVGVDSVWEQRKLEAREMRVNCAESPASSARGVGRDFKGLLLIGNLQQQFRKSHLLELHHCLYLQKKFREMSYANLVLAE